MIAGSGSSFYHLQKLEAAKVFPDDLSLKKSILNKYRIYLRLK